LSTADANDCPIGATFIDDLAARAAGTRFAEIGFTIVDSYVERSGSDAERRLDDRR